MQCTSRLSPSCTTTSATLTSRLYPSCTTFLLAICVSMIVFFFLLLPITQSKLWILTTKRNDTFLVSTQRNGSTSDRWDKILKSMFLFWSDHSPDYLISDKIKSASTRMPMGEKEGCDDGKRNLKLDLGDMEEATTCYTGVDKYGSSHIKNDKPVVLWKRMDQSKEVQFWWGFKYMSTVQVCRMPSANYSPKHKCMGTKIGRHRVQNIAITHRLQQEHLGQSRTHSWPAQTCMGKLRHVQVHRPQWK